jgi:prophage regulatory protein
VNDNTSNTQQHITANRPTIIRLPEVMQTIGLSRPSVYRMVKAGTFPQQVRLGLKAVGWFRAEVEQWLAELAQARPGSMPEQGLTSQRTAA